MIMIYYADLHSHTNCSDGNDTPCELILHAEERKVHVVGITDHDVLPPEIIVANGAEVPLEEFAQIHHVRIIPGVEYSCETYIEDCHVVGFGCDFHSPALTQISEEIKCYKEESYIELLDKLEQYGMPIAQEELLASTPGLTLADLQKKRIFDLMAAKKYVPDWKAGKLLVRSEKALEVKRKKPKAKDIIEALHAAGGRASLAHPFLIDPEIEYQGQRISRWKFIDDLISYGLDGIESRYPYSKTTCLDPRPNEVLWQEINRRFIGKLFISGGSDYHNDAKKGTSNPRELGECGLTKEEFLLFDHFLKG